MARRLLIVEDERAEREGLETFVEWGSLGFELLPSASDGEEGLGRILAERPAVVIADIRMPVMGGLEMIERLRDADPSGEGAPELIISTGYDEFDYARRALRLGAAEYLLKPIEREPLLLALGLCLERIERRERERLSWAALGPSESPGYKSADAALSELETSIRSLDPGRVEDALAKVRGALREPSVRRGAILDSIVDRWLTGALAFARRALASRGAEADGAAMLGRLRGCPDLDALCGAIGELSRALVGTLLEDAGERKARIVRLAVDSILRDFPRPVSLRSIADGIGVSPNYLGRVFSEIEGKGFTEYLTEVRMARAERLLSEGRLKVKAVAEAVGCPNVPYFCTLFKSFYGASPSRYFEP